METCRLCKVNPANQTGSHIFTYSLIKSAINEVGETVRGKELTFGISSTEFFSFYFGQKLQPETIEDIIGKEISEEDIEANANPFTIDNIVCTKCERLFTPVEDYFFNNIQVPLSKEKSILNNKKYGIHFQFEEHVSLLIRLYFYIQIWRASVSRYKSFQLDRSTEEKLRKILCKCLKRDIKDVIKTNNSNKDTINQFPIILSHLQTLNIDGSKVRSTNNLVYVDPLDKPFFFILNEFILQFYAQTKHTASSKRFYYGLSDILKDRVALNIKNEKLVLNQINDEQRLSIIKMLLSKLTNETLSNFVRDFSSIFLAEFGFLPSNRKVLEALNLYISQYKV